MERLTAVGLHMSTIWVLDTAQVTPLGKISADVEQIVKLEKLGEATRYVQVWGDRLKLKHFNTQG